MVENPWNEFPGNFTFGGEAGHSVEGIGSWLQYTDSVTNGLLGWSIILMVFIISFLSMKNYPTSKALAASFFITTVLAILLARIITFNPIFIMGLIVLTVVTTIMVAFEKPRAAI